MGIAIKSCYDGKGCNAGVCVPECRYFAPTGRVEFEEVEAELQKIEQVEADFNGKKSIRFRYTVIEEVSSNTDQEKYLEVGKRTSEDIDAFLVEGATRLKVQRFGAGTDTRYHVTSA